ncbi:hypothetical protein [Halalkalibacter lacteus]|uniref:hypothetical protein n=1 Tax=Halalkalibacter lacteus TaxID=3090663 RepID=UPI002FC6EEBA
MKRTYLIFTTLSIVLLILFAGCSQQPDIDMSKALDEWREHFEGVETVAASFDGESNIKLRVMVEEQLTQEEAVLLFNHMLDSIIEYSNSSDVWDNYNGYFEIVSYDDGMLYEATKLIGEDLDVITSE